MLLVSLPLPKKKVEGGQRTVTWKRTNRHASCCQAIQTHGAVQVKTRVSDLDPLPCIKRRVFHLHFTWNGMAKQKVESRE